ncbi:hypothetical protein AZE42_00713 [Rhizopogon vesiculosus]|uniref:Uncharacterized protein n=1 Tax=Rhizopogon vesiculosus TaxID=180088 RepID=A0A1J8PN47_9AGAM|nr:hypothetical protein AZE42_00713 [Rhizopogon vesiculosus]
MATGLLSLTYGYNIESQDHPMVKLVQKQTNILVKEGTAEKAALLEAFPFSKLLLPFVVSPECFEHWNSQISSILDSWPRLPRERCNRQTTGQGSVGSALRIHERRSCE